MFPEERFSNVIDNKVINLILYIFQSLLPLHYNAGRERKIQIASMTGCNSSKRYDRSLWCRVYVCLWRACFAENKSSSAKVESHHTTMNEIRTLEKILQVSASNALTVFVNAATRVRLSF